MILIVGTFQEKGGTFCCCCCQPFLWLLSTIVFVANDWCCRPLLLLTTTAVVAVNCQTIVVNHCCYNHCRCRPLLSSAIFFMLPIVFCQIILLLLSAIVVVNHCCCRPFFFVMLAIVFLSTIVVAVNHTAVVTHCCCLCQPLLFCWRRRVSTAVLSCFSRGADWPADAAVDGLPRAAHVRSGHHRGGEAHAVVRRTHPRDARQVSTNL